MPPLDVNYTAQIGKGVYLFQQVIIQPNWFSDRSFNPEDLGFSPVDVKTNLGRRVFNTVGLLLHLPMFGGIAVPGRLQSLDRQAAAKVSTGFYFLPVLWLFS